MKLPGKCPICGGRVVEKEVEEIVRGGNNTAFLKVHAGVCLKCGEHLYQPYTIKLFEETREKLEQNLEEGMQPVGKAYAASKSSK
jgi:YgiT-type zinc finger domain-containing protein